jgi:hypothetical protein
VTSGRLPDPEPAAAPPDRVRPSFGIRFLDGLAGLLAAGILLVGVLLMVAALVAPGLLAAAGLGPADGPGWGRVLAHLGVGVVGELVVRLRGGWPMATRIGADAAVTVAVLVLIWWAWLP